MAGSLDGKVALVTGSSRGIGKAIALELAGAGAVVGVNYVRNAEAAQAVVQEITAHGGKAVALQADVSVPEQAHGLVDRTVRDLGGLDILVNNAGINRDRTLRRMSLEEWHDVINTDLNSVFYCTSRAFQTMTEVGGGHIICISSVVGQTGNYGQANYAAAKAGIIGFAKAAALEVAQFDIRVNTICPGFILTDMVDAMPDEVKERVLNRIPLSRFGLAENVAGMVRYLVLEGEFITGAVFNVNGGMYM